MEPTLALKPTNPILHHLPPTPLTPNSPYPLLHYPRLLDPHTSPSQISTLFATNAWRTQWLIRYAPTQRAHYHSTTHECMAVLCGTATLRFGASDLTPTEEPAAPHEEGGVEIEARAGDVFVIPAGVSHKTFNAAPEREFAILSGGEGRGMEVDLDEVGMGLEGFVMLGAYPVGGVWDFCVGGEGGGDVERPERDPVIGEGEEGLRGVWK